MGRFSRYDGNYTRRPGLMELIKFLLFIYLLFDFFLVGLTPSHHWILIIMAIFVFGMLFGKTKLFTLSVLLLALLVVWAGGPVSDRIEAAGRRIFPQRLFDAANQHINKTAAKKDPTSALRQATQIATKEDQQALNACLTQTAHDYSQQTATHSADLDLVANESKFCAGKAGSDLTNCMNKNVFNGTNVDADMAADQCAGASTSTFANTQDKLRNEALGVGVAVLCTGAEMANTLFGWAGLNLSTSKCVD